MTQDDLIKIAKIIYAEGSVFIDKCDTAIIAIAQCVHDLYNTGDYQSIDDCLSRCFTAPSESTVLNDKCLEAARVVFEQGERRFDDAQILQFRSFAKYSDGYGNLDTSKVQNLLENYDYLGSDSINNQWGHFYFGRKEKDDMSKFKVLIICGHGEGDPGACATLNGKEYQEYKLTRESGAILQDELLNSGITAVLYDTYKNAVKRIKSGEKIDVKGFDYVIELHLNASTNVDAAGDGRKKGSMFYIDQSETGHSVEDAILNELYAIGSTKAWDGVVITQRQFSNGLVVQNHIRAQGVSHALLELCFITDADDINWYETNKKNIAVAIRKGIIKGFGLEITNKSTNYMVKVMDPALNIRKGPGTDYQIVGCIKDMGCYTIVEESAGAGSTAGWGRLLSGAGWISLDFCKKI